MITAKSNSAGSKEIVLSLLPDTELLVVFEQVKNVVHEIILVGILFIMQSVLEGLFEYRHHVDSVGCRHELQGTLDFFNKLVPARYCLLVHVDFVCNYNARNVRTLVAHLLVPIPQILIGDLPIDIEHQNACVRSEVVRRMEFIERLLPGCVPNI